MSRRRLCRIFSFVSTSLLLIGYANAENLWDTPETAGIRFAFSKIPVSNRVSLATPFKKVDLNDGTFEIIWPEERIYTEIIQATPPRLSVRVKYQAGSKSLVIYEGYPPEQVFQVSADSESQKIIILFVRGHAGSFSLPKTVRFICLEKGSFKDKWEKEVENLDTTGLVSDLRCLIGYDAKQKNIFFETYSWVWMKSGSELILREHSREKGRVFFPTSF